MSGLRKLIFWACLLFLGYHGLNFVRVQTSSDVLAYKRFAKALLKNDPYSVRQASSAEVHERAFSQNDARMKLYNGGRILFTYFDVVSQNVAKNGSLSRLVVDQISRVSSSGQPGFWGDREIRVRHTVELERADYLWIVTRFVDPAMH